MDWTRADIISALALIVSAISGLISWRAYQRTAAAQHPHFSFDFEAFDKPEWWQLECFIDNRSLVGLEPVEVRTSRFRAAILSLYKGAYIGGEPWHVSDDIETAPLTKSLALDDLAYPIDPQSQGQFTILLKAPPGRRRLVVRCRTIEAKPRVKRFILHPTIPQSPEFQWIKAPRQGN